jgi:hypothetical protein
MGVRNLKRAAQERERGMKGLDKGGQGPISSCCPIEDEEGIIINGSSSIYKH